MAAYNTHTHYESNRVNTSAYLTVNGFVGRGIRMRMRDLLTRIQSATGANQTELSRKFDVSQPTVSRWLNGEDEPTGVKRDLIMAEAESLGLIAARKKFRSASPQIIGYVGAGGAIDFSEGQGPFGDAEMPPDEGENGTVAVIVRGDSMSPQLEDGWVVYYNERHEAPAPDHYNKLCVVGLSDGRVFIKKLHPGRQSGKFDLYSFNAAPMLDAEIAWVAPVTFIAVR